MQSLTYLSPARPGYLVWFVTNRCNLGCVTCFYREALDDEEREEFTVDEFERTAPTMPRDIFQLSITGGEPFIREDILEISSVMIRAMRPSRVSFSTNGTFPERTVATIHGLRRLFPRTRFAIDISIDHAGEGLDEITGGSGTILLARETHDALHAIRDSMTRINACLVVSPWNLDTAKETTTILLGDWSFDEIILGFYRGVVEDPRARRKMIEVHEALASLVAPASSSLERRLFRSLYRDLARVFGEGRRRRCLAGRKLIVISETGLVMPCESCDHLATMGDLRASRYDLGAVLSSEEARIVRGRIRREGCSSTYECARLATIFFSPSRLLASLLGII